MTAGKRLKVKERGEGRGFVSGKGTLGISCRVASVFLFEVESKAICRQWGNVAGRMWALGKGRGPSTGPAQLTLGTIKLQWPHPYFLQHSPDQYRTLVVFKQLC